MFRLFHNLIRKDRAFVKAITNVTNIAPDNVYLYTLALTHTSFAKQNTSGKQETNERLEFLGDSILGAVIAEFLFKKFPYKDEGFLTEIRSRIVNRESLNHIAVRIGLNALVKIDQNNANARYKSINGNALEALVGAIYLDKGYKTTKKFVLDKLIKPHFDINTLVNTTSNFKSKLIEWAQGQNKSIRFDTVEQKQSGNVTEFKAEVIIDDKPLATGNGYSKKKAEQMAAEKSLALLNVG